MLESANEEAMSVNQMLGQRLREARLRRKISLREFARQLEVSPATMSALESGRTGISAMRLARVAGLLGTPIADLLLSEHATTGGHGIDDALSPPRDVDASQPALGKELADWRLYQPLQLDPPLRAALAAFLEFGYHGATVRDVAQRAGLSVPGVYHYYPSKQHMLVAVLDLTMDDLATRSIAARAEGRAPVERFSLLIQCLALFHTNRRELGFVGASEMRSLAPAERARIAASRRAQQQMVDVEVDAACLEGSFKVARPHEASRAVVNMCTSLSGWYDGKGASTAEEIAAHYVEFALDLMRFVPRPAQPDAEQPESP